MSAEIRRPKISGSLPGGLNPEGATYASSVNQFPTISVGGHYSGEVQKPQWARMLSSAGQAQSHGRSGESTLNVTLDDGDGGTLTFDGIYSAPGIADVAGVFNGVHNASLMSNFDPSIYVVDRWQDIREGIRKIEGSIGERLAALLQFAVENWQSNFQEKYRSTEAMVAALEIHKANEKPLSLLLQMFASSAEGTEIDGADQFLSRPQINFEFNNYLLQTLCQRPLNYFNTLQQLMSTFGLVYIPPSTSEGAGELATFNYLFNQAEDLEVDVETLNGTFGLSDITPISHVTVARVQGAPIFKEPKDLANKIMPGETVEALVRVPDTTTGRGLTIPFPPVFQFAAQSTFQSGKFGNSQTMGAAAENARKTIEGIAPMLEAAKSLARFVATQTFRDVSLASSHLSLGVPADVTIHPGKVVNVKDRREGTLGQGLLHTVTHSISRGSVTTSLQFSHWQAGSYRLGV